MWCNCTWRFSEAKHRTWTKTLSNCSGIFENVFLEASWLVRWTRLSGVSWVKKTNTTVSERCRLNGRNDVIKDCNVKFWCGGQTVWERNESIHVCEFWTAISDKGTCVYSTVWNSLYLSVSLFLAVDHDKTVRSQKMTCETNSIMWEFRSKQFASNVKSYIKCLILIKYKKYLMCTFPWNISVGGSSSRKINSLFLHHLVRHL